MTIWNYNRKALVLVAFIRTIWSRTRSSDWSPANTAHTAGLFSEAVLMSCPRVDHLWHVQIYPRSHENDSFNVGGVFESCK